jgi:single-strand DNA-binding protein
MASFNQITIVGHLTRDPMVRNLPSGTTVTDFGVAANHRYKVNDEHREEVCFIDVSFFGRAGDTIAQYIKKGDPILVSGRLAFEQWEDKNGGGKRSKHKIIGDTFTFLPRSDGNHEQEERPDRQSKPVQRATRPASAPRPPAEQPFGDEQQFKDDDIPF